MSLNTLENLAIIPDEAIVDKGFYVPNLTTEQMSAFQPSSSGVIIFNTDSKKFMTFSENKWLALIPATGGNHIPTGTDDPINPEMGFMYYHTETDRLRFFTYRWCSVGIAWGPEK